MPTLDVFDLRKDDVGCSRRQRFAGRLDETLQHAFPRQLSQRGDQHDQQVNNREERIVSKLCTAGIECQTAKALERTPNERKPAQTCGQTKAGSERSGRHREECDLWFVVPGVVF